MYRDIPTPDEVDKFFNENPPMIPDNAQALFEYALSHIPERILKIDNIYIYYYYKFHI